MAESNVPTLENTRSIAHYESATLDEYLSSTDLIYNALIRRRLEEVRLRPEDQLHFATFPVVFHMAALITPDDPDTVAVLPCLAAIAAASSRLDLRILRDDDDLTLFDRLVDDVELAASLDELDLPQVFFFDDEWQIREQWGPRPKEADRQLDEWLSENPQYEALADNGDDVAGDDYLALLDSLVYNMRLWYNSGLNQACINELRQVLDSLRNDAESNDNQNHAGKSG